MSRKGFKVNDPKQQKIESVVNITVEDDFIEGEDSSSEKSDMLNLGGLWVNTSKKDGSKYMSGSFGRLKIMVFKNHAKTKKEHPDYNMVLAEKQKPAYGEELVPTPTAEEQAEAAKHI